MHPWRFYFFARSYALLAMVRSGYRLRDVRRVMAAVDEEQIDALISEESIDTSAIGDGTIIDKIIEFFNSPAGQQLLQAIIQLLIGLIGGGLAAIMKLAVKATAVLLFLIYTPLAFAADYFPLAPDLPKATAVAQPTTADAQPTPWPELKIGLELLELTEADALVDYGCGYDARFLIAACRYYGASGVGLELDEGRAKSARDAVRYAGLEKWILVHHADAITTDYYTANVGVAYLYPKTLAKLRPRIEKLRRFASYQSAVPGLAMKQVGNWYVWTRPVAKSVVVAPVVQTQAVTSWGGYEMLPQGSFCEVCGGYCRSPMKHRQQTVQIAPVQTATPAVTTSTCVNGSCSNGGCSTSRSWYPGRLLGR